MVRLIRNKRELDLELLDRQVISLGGWALLALAGKAVWLKICSPGGITQARLLPLNKHAKLTPVPYPDCRCPLCSYFYLAASCAGSWPFQPIGLSVRALSIKRQNLVRLIAEEEENSVNEETERRICGM